MLHTAHVAPSRPQPAPRSVRALVPLVLGALLSLGSCSGESAPDPRPNVLLVTLDTVRADRLGCYGYAKARTPNLDALAARGVRFERAYASTPYTLPSHATLLSGDYPGGHGLHINFQGAVNGASALLPEELAKRGYATAAFVACGVLDRRFGLARGFERYDDLSHRPLQASGQVERPCDEVTRSALAWLAQPAQRPFFAWLHYYDAHDPHVPPEGFRDFDDPYDGEIAAIDAELGKVLRELERTGRLANTCIVVCADHGEDFGEHGVEGHGLFLYDTTMRVPMIVAGPSPIRSGATVAAPVGLVDVRATILDVLGTPAPAGSDGTSFAPALRGEPARERPVFLETEYPMRAFGWEPLYGVVSDRWKYIRAPASELYDVVADPLETKNQLDAEAGAHATLDALLAKLRAQSPRRPAVPVQLGFESRAALSKLGYVEGDDVEDDAAAPQRADPKTMTDVYNGAVHARAFLRTGRHAEALALVAPLVQKSPQSSHLWEIQGAAQLALKQAAEAVHSFERSLAGSPNDTERLCQLGDALAAAGRSEEALARYRRAIELDPHDGQSEGHLGGFLARSGKLDEALPHFQRHVELEPTSPNAHTNLANGLFALRRFEAGIEHLRRALQLDPLCAPAHQALYTGLRFTKGKTEAVVALRAARRALPEGTYFAMQLSFELATARNASDADVAEALQLAEECHAKAPGDGDVLDILGVVRARRGDFAGAIEAATHALELANAAGRADAAKGAQARLALYRAGKAYTE
ncbi:MAG: sulfatase-like hydrolase/transferase [Planctomycetes bacterium]|nr:sulfatase-like hydrolase/transferase [Planctomycetota bacterium]